ncbi:hypothetical protein OIU77_004041, partial [Salix suchowensis]
MMPDKEDHKLGQLAGNVTIFASEVTIMPLRAILSCFCLEFVKSSTAL